MVFLVNKDMYLFFKKILNSNPAQLGDIIVETDSILFYNADTLLDQKRGINYQATRVEISNFPGFSFHTLSTVDQISSVLDVHNLTLIGGVSDPTEIKIIYPISKFPMIKASMLVNDSFTEVENCVFNPKYIVFAEDIIVRDRKTSLSKVALLIVLRDSQPRRLVLNLDFNDIQSALNATIVPV